MILQDGMRLYHGSYTIVRNPDLSRCGKDKDFGRGFYLTTDRTQAEKFVRSSVSKAEKEGLIKENQKKGYVSEFRFHQMNQGIKVYEFSAVNEEWLHCIVSHRRPSLLPDEYNQWKQYDIIAGKIANDNTNPTINFYLSGAYGNVGSDQAVKLAIEILRPFRLNNQICFRTEKSLQCLSYEGDKEISW